MVETQRLRLDLDQICSRLGLDPDHGQLPGQELLSSHEGEWTDAMSRFLMAVFLLAMTGWVQAGPDLQTDAGRRWKVVPPMMVHLRAAEAALDSDPATTLQGHRRIAERLDSSLKALVANCTMTGPAHDELHKWLVPFLGSAKGYQEETDLTELARRRAELKREFRVFHNYFE
jgi:hypothetical protein